MLLCNQVYCETVSNGGLPSEPYQFKVAYDKLVIAAGAEPLTFGIKGVYENAFFLREVNHAQEIRKKLLLNLMLSENPGKCYLLKDLKLLKALFSKIIGQEKCPTLFIYNAS